MGGTPSLFSPLEGEMSPKATEGVASEGTAIGVEYIRTYPPRPLRDHPPLKGEGKCRP